MAFLRLSLAAAMFVSHLSLLMPDQKVLYSLAHLDDCARPNQVYWCNRLEIHFISKFRKNENISLRAPRNGFMVLKRMIPRASQGMVVLDYCRAINDTSVVVTAHHSCIICALRTRSCNPQPAEYKYQQLQSSDISCHLSTGQVGSPPEEVLDPEAISRSFELT